MEQIFLDIFVFSYYYDTRKSEKICIKMNRVAVTKREPKTEADS